MRFRAGDLRIAGSFYTYFHKGRSDNSTIFSSIYSPETIFKNERNFIMKTINFEKLNNRITFTLAMSESEFNDNFAICHDCGSVVPIDSALECNGEYFCNNCTSTCFSCGAVMADFFFCIFCLFLLWLLDDGNNK